LPDYLGNIAVPEITPSGTFPLIPDYPHGRAHRPEVVIHQFGSGNAKIEQRFLLGTGARRAWLCEADRIALRDFWEQKYGPYGAFTYHAPNDNGLGTTAYTCRFANEPLSWEMLADWACSLGVTQQIIPLVKIQPLQPGYPAIYVSDRRCTIGSQLHQARLVEFDGISQAIGNESDEAQFTFGNADRVMRDLANDVDLYRASIEFSWFHVGTGVPAGSSSKMAPVAPTRARTPPAIRASIHPTDAARTVWTTTSVASSPSREGCVSKITRRASGASAARPLPASHSWPTRSTTRWFRKSTPTRPCP